MSIELIIVIAVVAAGGLVWFVNRDKGLDVNNDGKVDLADAKVAVENTVAAVEEKVEKTVKKAVKKKTAKPKASKDVDLESLSKTLLLDYAKTHGIKANASLKKEEILERIKNG